MLSSIAVRAGELLAVVAVVGAVLVAVAAAGVWWLRRRVRRLRAVGGTAAARARRAVADGTARQWRPWLVRLPDRRWLATVGARRRLWRAVRGAERSVALAREAGAPAGELQVLCRQLRGAASGADRLLAMPHPAASADSPGSAQAGDLVTIAGHIQAAAADAAAAMSRPAVAGLADEVRREAEALSAGIMTAVGEAGANARSAAVR